MGSSEKLILKELEALYTFSIKDIFPFLSLNRTINQNLPTLDRSSAEAKAYHAA